jgi:hypothetical protein
MALPVGLVGLLLCVLLPCPFIAGRLITEANIMPLAKHECSLPVGLSWLLQRGLLECKERWLASSSYSRVQESTWPCGNLAVGLPCCVVQSIESLSSPCHLSALRSRGYCSVGHSGEGGVLAHLPRVSCNRCSRCDTAMFRGCRPPQPAVSRWTHVAFH